MQREIVEGVRKVHLLCDDTVEKKAVVFLGKLWLTTEGTVGLARSFNFS